MANNGMQRTALFAAADAKGVKQTTIMDSKGTSCPKSKPETMGPKGKFGGTLVWCSALGHIYGVLVSALFQIVTIEEGASLTGILVWVWLVFFIGYPYILLTWIVVALPAAAIAFHFHAHRKTGLLAIIGTILGIVATHLPFVWGTGLAGISRDSLIFGGMNGGLSAVGFSLLARVWLDRQG